MRRLWAYTALRNRQRDGIFNRGVLINTVSVVVKIVAAFAANKMLALYLGPAGFGVWGNVSSIMTACATFANGAINQGVVFRVCSASNSIERDRWHCVAAVFALVVPVVLFSILALMPLGDWIALDGVVFGGELLVFLFASSLGLFIQAQMLSQGAVGLNSLYVIMAPVLVAVAIAIVGRAASLQIIYVSYVAATSLAVLVMLFFCVGSVSWPRNFWAGGWEWEKIRVLGRHSTIGLSSALIGTAFLIGIRELIARQLGAAEVGLWQCLARTSDVVSAFTTSSILYVIMPRILAAGQGHRRRFLNMLRSSVLPILSFGGLYVTLMFVLREYIVVGLYSAAYIDVAELLPLQAVGDVLRLFTVPVIAYISHQGRVAQAWLVEVVYVLSYFCIAKGVLLGGFGLVALPVGYIAANIVLGGVLAVLVRVESEVDGVLD